MKAGWQKKTIRDVCEVMNGGTPKTGVPEYWDGQYQWITPAEMGKRSTPFVSKTERTISKQGLNNSSASILPEYSVILSSRAPIGHLVINTVPMATNQGCKGLIPNGSLNYQFLFYYLTSIVPLLNELGTGTTFKEISGSKLKEVPILLPPLPEQQRIVKILDQAFEGLATAKANAEKNLLNARALFESYLDSVFIKHGEGWETEKLGDVSIYLNRGVSPSYLDEGGICVLNQKCVREHRVSYEQSRRHDIQVKPVSEERYIQLGDVLVNSTGVGTLGRVAQLREKPTEPTIVDSHVSIVRPNPSKFFMVFFGYMLIHIEKEIQEAGEGCGGQTELARSVLAENFRVSYPKSLAVQKHIVEQLDLIGEKSKSLEAIYQQKSEELDALKKSLLHQAFQGEL